MASSKFNSNIDGSNVSFYNGMFNASARQAVDPYITGYAYAVWIRRPSFLDTTDWETFEKLFYQNFRSLDGISDITLETTQIGFGFNNNESNFVSNISKSNTEFNVNHIELAGSLMRKFYENWIYSVRDPLTGVATYVDSNNPYRDHSHTGDLLYFTTKPVLISDANKSDSKVLNDVIEFACVYRNVMPKTVPLNHMNMSEGSHDTVNFSQSFKGDMFYNENIRQYVVDNYAKVLRPALDKAYKQKTMAEITVADEENVALTIGTNK